MKKHFILITIIIAAISTKSEDECCFESKRAFKNNQRITLSDFDSFNELKFNCSQSFNVSVLQFKPNKLIVLDNSLKFKDLNLKPTESILLVVFTNLKGYDVNSNVFKNFLSFNRLYPTGIWYSIEKSNLDLYSSNSLITNNSCNEFLPNYLVRIEAIIFESTVIYSSDLCPYAFRGAHITMIQLVKISSNLVSKNLLSFKKLPDEEDLNIQISHLVVSLYHVDFNSKLFNQHVFKKTVSVDLEGIINLIEADIFKKMVSLKLFRIKTQNIKNIFVRNNKWLEYLNWNVRIEPSSINTLDSNVFMTLIVYQSMHNVMYYDFPDEDFCLFKNFPHKQMVYPYFKPLEKSQCTCTQLYLIQYWYNIREMIRINNKYVLSEYYFMQYYSDSILLNDSLKCFNSSFEDTIKKCNFAIRLKNCQINNISNTRVNNDFYFYIYDWQELSSFIRYVFTTYINLIFSAIAFLINIFLIVILSTKTIKEKIYAYLKLYAYSNLFYTLIPILKYFFSRCGDDVFCNDVYQSVYSQYVTIIVIKVLGNSLKTCSNVAHLLFTISRYLMISNTKKFSILKKINELSMFKFISATLIFSLTMNVYIYFEYSISSSDSNVGKFHEMKANVYLRQEPIDDYKENFSTSEYWILNIFQYIRIIFSDLAYLVLLLLIDILLLLFIKNQMKTRKVLTNNVTQIVQSEALARTKRKQERAASTRITKMIVFNCINFVIFRFPLAVLSFYGFFYRFNSDSKKYEPSVAAYIICKGYKFCESLENVLFFLYLFSYLIQLTIFCTLDKNFKESLAHLKKKILRR